VQLLGGIHEDFYKCRNMTDEADLDERWQMAEMLLRHFKFYDFKMQEMKVSNKIEKMPEDEDLQSVLLPGKKLIYF
jgi:hypothetical protein